MKKRDVIQITGARENNLKDVSLEIPKGALTVFTGVSGSGKSSLAFETLFAEGQRRYLETVSIYARQYIGKMERPDVDKITGLSAVISIEQKTTNKNPRSTVGTVTEIYDLLRLLFSRIAIGYSPTTGSKMVKYSGSKLLSLLETEFLDKKIGVLAPLVSSRKGHYRELFDQLQKKGYLYARVDGNIIEMYPTMKLDRFKLHTIELVVDRFLSSKDTTDRIKKSVETALTLGKGNIVIYDYNEDKARHFSQNLMCPDTGASYPDPEPNIFSFNSPVGACKKCKGLGIIPVFDIDKLVPDKKKSVIGGAIEAFPKKIKDSGIFKILEAVALRHEFSLETPFKELDTESIGVLLYGTEELLIVHSHTLGRNIEVRYDGLFSYIEQMRDSSSSEYGQKWAEQFSVNKECEECNGTRLSKVSNFFKIDNKSISEITAMELDVFYNWIELLPERLEGNHLKIGVEILKEIRERTSFLLNVGLGYLSLSRSSKTLSGGESQRIRLATQIGSKLVNILYILDEPSIGLHQRDNQRLIKSLLDLRDHKNTLVVVEHDEDMIRSADWVVDIGPLAGNRGGHIDFAGTPQELMASNTLTARYMKGEYQVAQRHHRVGNGKHLVLMGATGNNLKNVSVKLPLGTLITVSGVSGSGKSSLIKGTLFPILNKFFFKSYGEPLPYESILGLEYIDKVVEVDQSPIGRTPRSNPATYTNVFGDIRKIYEMLPESKIRGYKAGRFSFNVKGGRCEMCKGAGLEIIEMNFLPDVFVKCKICNGKRYNRETLQVRYKGKSISEVLDMTIEAASEFFEKQNSIYIKLKALCDVGLGYLKLGHPSPKLSGGEAQRVKLATELAKKDTGNTFYIFDEPTTGLHFNDIKLFMEVVNLLVDKGNTVLIIEHNIDVIKNSDYIVDIGPDGGRSGGSVVACGDVEAIKRSEISITGKYL